MASAFLLLFPTYPRECGNWSRVTVNSVEDVQSFIALNNGVNECGISIYDNRLVIDKLFFDFDDETSGNCDKALKDAQRTYDYLLDKQVSVIPLASGVKGIHLHGLLEPFHHSGWFYGKENLNIVCDVERMLRNTLLSVLSEAGAISDTHCTDIRRLCRIPNTLRPPHNQSYCTFLPPDEFTSLTWNDVVRYTKHTNEFTYRVNRRKSLLDLTSSLPPHRRLVQSKTVKLPHVQPVVSKRSSLLERLLRPCIYYHLLQPEPKHAIRVAATIDLHDLGFSNQEIVDTFRKLNWRDWREGFTADQVENIAGNYTRYGCARLKSLGFAGEYCGRCLRPVTLMGE